ncbi:hypothetical protein D3C75_955140 [compost metagenome]
MVVAQQSVRERVDRRGRIAFAEQRVDGCFLVEGDVDGFTHTHVAQVFVSGVDGDVRNGHRVQFVDFEVGVFPDALDVVRFRVQRDLAFVGLELLQAHVVVGGDGEDQ